MPQERASSDSPTAPSIRAMATSTRPTGDFAFAAAVAAFGQTMRGDEMMMDFSYDDVAALAKGQGDFWRQEFLELVGVADSLKGG